MKRLTTSALLALGDELVDRERNLLFELARLRLASHSQLAALMSRAGGRDTQPASAAPIARRDLKRLTDLGLLARLERRVGGVRAGSAGFVYYLGPAGQRLVAYWNGDGLVRGRYRPEPGSRYVRHRLAVTQLYVDLLMARDAGELDLLAFDVEPGSWRSVVDPFGAKRLLKPDAYLRVGVGAYEEHGFVEVDLGTESRPVLARKLRAYIDYFSTGQEQAQIGVSRACSF